MHSIKIYLKSALTLYLASYCGTQGGPTLARTASGAGGREKAAPHPFPGMTPSQRLGHGNSPHSVTPLGADRRRCRPRSGSSPLGPAVVIPTKHLCFVSRWCAVLAHASPRVQTNTHTHARARKSTARQRQSFSTDKTALEVSSIRLERRTKVK